MDKIFGDIFVNGMLIALSNLTGSLAFPLTRKFFRSKAMAIAGTAFTCVFSVLFMIFEGAFPSLSTALYIIIRGLEEFLMGYCLIMNVEYFTTLYQSRVMSITSGVGKLFAMLSPLAAETIKNPMLLLPAIKGGIVLFLCRLREPEQESNPNTK